MFMVFLLTFDAYVFCASFCDKQPLSNPCESRSHGRLDELTSVSIGILVEMNKWIFDETGKRLRKTSSSMCCLSVEFCKMSMYTK